jgi:hypothetical protein
VLIVENKPVPGFGKKGWALVVVMGAETGGIGAGMETLGTETEGIVTVLVDASPLSVVLAGNPPFELPVICWPLIIQTC